MILQLISPIPKEALYSNRAASQDEVGRILSFLSEQDVRLPLINEKIDQLQSQLERLQRERDEIRELQRTHRGLISATRRIPPEVWSEIFLRCLPPDDFAKVDINQAPLLLPRVCSQWREVSYSTQALWSSIGIVRGRDHKEIPPTLIRAWLARSHGFPLSISLDDIGPEDITNDIPDALIHFSDRWRTLHLDSWQSVIRKLMCNPGVSAPYLETLNFSSSDELDEDAPLQFSQTLHSLRNVELSVDRFIPFILQLPYHQLHELRSSSIVDINDCFEVMRVCANLTHLSLRNIADDPLDLPPVGIVEPRIILSRLCWLELASFTELGPLLDRIVTPKLAEIALEINHWAMDAWPKSELQALVARSSSPLEILTLDKRGVSQEEVVECFQHIQTLRHMSIRDREGKRMYCRIGGGSKASARRNFQFR